MTIVELFRDIRKCPEVYFGEATLSRFDAFLSGWQTSIPDPHSDEIMEGFQVWVAEKYRMTNTRSWANIIRFYAANDVAALQDAFILFEEYLETLETGGQPPI